MMDWVDYVILGLLALAALHGWRTGAVRQVLSFGGFWLGLVLGVIIAPPIARLASPQHRGLVAMIVLLVTVLVLASLGDVIGSRVARVLRRVRLGIIDDGLGIGVAVVATLLVVWLIGNLVSVSQITSVDRGVQNSVILRAADGSLPTVPALFTRIESFLAGRGFPVVFVNLPAQVLPAVAQPTTLAVRAARNAAGPSTVKVTGSACGAIVEGSGFVVAPQLIVTNAHVVAGDGSPRVVDGSGSHAATPVWFDPKLDVAVLEVPGLSDPPLQIDASTVARGTQSAVLGFPEDGGLTIIPSAIDGAFPAPGLDIYGRSTNCTRRCGPATRVGRWSRPGIRADPRESLPARSSDSCLHAPQATPRSATRSPWAPSRSIFTWRRRREHP
jgi:uncharacterized membrane protein required for colicin V production